MSNRCHQMSDFKAKMHQNRFRPRPRWGSLQRSPDPLRGPTSKGYRKGGEGEREGKAGGGEEPKKGRKGGGREGRGPPCVSLNFPVE